MIVPSKWLILVDIHYIMIYSTALLCCTSTDTLILTLSLVGAVGCARQVVDADSNAWSAKQTFDSREKSGARHAGRPRRFPKLSWVPQDTPVAGWFMAVYGKSHKIEDFEGHPMTKHPYPEIVVELSPKPVEIAARLVTADLLTKREFKWKDYERRAIYDISYRDMHLFNFNLYLGNFSITQIVEYCNGR